MNRDELVNKALALIGTIPEPTPPTMLEDILVDLLCNIPHVAISTTEDFDIYWGQAGYWLNQIDEGEERKAWTWRFAFAIHQAWGVPMDRATKCLRWAMADARGEADA